MWRGLELNLIPWKLRRNVLFLRAFSLDDLDDYEKHFTVMNYAPGVTLKQVSKQSKTLPHLAVVRRSSSASLVTVAK